MDPYGDLTYLDGTWSYWTSIRKCFISLGFVVYNASY